MKTEKSFMKSVEYRALQGEEGRASSPWIVTDEKVLVHMDKMQQVLHGGAGKRWTWEDGLK